jgi:DNA repair protein RecO
MVSFLKRNGEKIKIVFYGGQGGGKKQKPTLLEYGYMLALEIKPSHKEDGIHVAKEWQIKWQHELIRNDYKAFLLLSFYLELIEKVSIEHHADQEGLFRVLSNALFYLEDSLKKKHFYPYTHLTLFLTKLIFELGIAPDFRQCALCGGELIENKILSFEAQEGGFICIQCADKEVLKSNLVQIDQATSILFYRNLKFIWDSKYSEYEKINLSDRLITDKLFHYFCFQFHFNTQEFKTFSLIH